MNKLDDGLTVGGGAAVVSLPGNSSNPNAGTGASGHTMVHGGLMNSGGFRVVDPSAMSPRSGNLTTVSNGTKITFPNTMFYLEVTQGKVNVYMRNELGSSYFIGKSISGWPVVLMGAGGMMYGVASGTTKYRFHKLFEEDPY